MDAAPPAMPHRLAPPVKSKTVSGKVSAPRFLGAPINFR